ncbi:MAG: hypothetical protein A3G81_10720 [Betaproteobacteria bacterium RIFCSPLOWO2_12_FULL_65_14]|nr:MAG: hypothetical protein A3G81_10720 [Betaproteobacteria bacterium RIFCSPLOWO2_12_FULL_65_14]
MIRQVRSEFSGRIATLTLDRPARRNALSADLMRELIACAQELSARADIDAVILAGAGSCFSAGADLKDESRWAGNAAIEGYAVGGGLALALALDWRVMARDAFLSLPEISLGIPLTWGTLPRLVNLAGPARAKRLAILGERIGADAALALGLADEVCDRGSAMQAAIRLANMVLEKPRHSVRMTKEAVNAYAGIGAHAVSYMAHDQFELAAASPESRAARESALKGRKS